jgi:DNA-binding transcriptional LysR family regulator
MPFAAQSYINTYGLPATYEELTRQRFVLHVAEQTQATASMKLFLPDLAWPGAVAVQTNVASAHLWAVSKGAGIGWLPTYTHFIGGRIAPIDVKPRFVLDIWLTYHPDVARIARVRRVIDWLRDSFDAQKFPWFGERFIHPYD